MERPTPHAVAEHNSIDIDIWLIRDNLRLTHEKRVIQHQDTLNCIDFLRQIGTLHHAKPPGTSESSDS